MLIHVYFLNIIERDLMVLMFKKSALWSSQFLNMVWIMLHGLLCDALAPSTAVLPYLSPSLPQPDWPSQWPPCTPRCLRHSCPTLGLSDPPQHPSKFCLNVAFPRDYPLSFPTTTTQVPQTLWLLFLLVPFNLAYHQEVLWKHICTCISLCLFTPELFHYSSHLSY